MKMPGASFVIVLAVPTLLLAQSAARPEILLLGTFHMANPGKDINNISADDVRAPRRQQELAQLLDVLKQFHPTKIAVEADITSKRVAREYADYLAGKYPLSPNEIDQVGYRLAKELGQSAVYPVDVDGDFPYYRVLNYAKANGLMDKFDVKKAADEKRSKAMNDYLSGHSILETLEVINSDSSVARDVASYFDYVPFGEPWEYAGPDLLAAWFQRNIRIYHNIRALASSPNDRILVVYGYGHLGFLRQDIRNDASVRLRTLADLTTGQR